MYLLMQRWQEPTPGSTIYVIDITKADAERLHNVLEWLEENAGESWGDTLCEWKLDEKRIYGEADFTGINEVLTMLASESRYNENPNDPGCYYYGQNPDLDGR